MPFVLPFVAATALFASFANMGAMAVKLSLLTAALQAVSIALLILGIAAVALYPKNRDVKPK
jgi:hypothetical protein